MPNLEDALKLILEIKLSWLDAINDPGTDIIGIKKDIEILDLVTDIIVSTKESEESKGDRLDKLIDHLYEDNGGYSLHALSNILVCLNVIEEHCKYLGFYNEMGKCNELQHKILG
jgi:hypothetical protein